MRRPTFTKQFERDLKLAKKRGKDLEKVKAIIASLIEELPLEERYRDHLLIGNYRGRRECHIESNWLLIYFLEDAEIIFERTGTHADLFE